MSGDRPDGANEPDPADEHDAELRHLLRGLPEVDPPDGFFDDLIRRRRRRALAVAAGGLAAAAVVGAVVVAQASGIAGEASPPMGELADRHAAVLSADARSLRGGMDGDQLPAPYQAPEVVGGMQRGLAVHHDDDVVQVVYAADGHYVSVFEDAGELDDDAMADGLTSADLDGVRAWWTDDGALVVRRDDVVYVIVGDVDPDAAEAMVDDLPDARPMGLGDRMRDAMDDLVEAFGL